MRSLLRILRWLAALVVLVVTSAAIWLAAFPPELIRLGTAYTAKIVCSNQFIADRDGAEVLAVDVQAPGHPLLGFMKVSTDAGRETVTARLFGLFAAGTAMHREGLGCATIPDGDFEAATIPPLPEPDAAAAPGLWPDGDMVEPAGDPAIQALLDDPGLVGPGMRAVVVVRDGRIVAERYGDGFSAVTPLLGWSMTKSVTAAIIGTLVRDGRLSLDQDGLLEEWNGDERGAITLADLMAMSSGLEFNEDYGSVTDVTRMLYLEPDMAAFAASKPAVAAPGERFSYSSGTTVLLSRIWQEAFDDPEEALRWPREALFDPLGMRSAVLEADARGTYVGSSYLYATARDWARFGELLRRGGEWNGKQILPEGYVDWMREPAPASGSAYGRGQVWLVGPGGASADEPYELPDDVFWILGHDGQSVAVVPSQRLVVVRMGLTPSKLGYRSQRLLEAVAHAAK